MSDVRLQEIIARAVVGRGDRRVVWSHAAPAEGADSVLGVHVTQVKLKVEEQDGEAALRITATCDLWCSHGEKTEVHRLTCSHTEPATVRLSGSLIGEAETSASLVRGPRCIRAEVEDGQLAITLECDVAVEVVGMARLWVKAYDLLEEESGEEVSDSSSVSEISLSEEVESESEELEGLATLAGELPPAKEPDLVPAISEVRPVPRRAPVISHFQQSSGSSRISIIQGH
ncbi:MAG: outer spore coat protein CotE [Bacillota bacterium]